MPIEKGPARNGDLPVLLEGEEIRLSEPKTRPGHRGKEHGKEEVVIKKPKRKERCETKYDVFVEIFGLSTKHEMPR